MDPTPDHDQRFKALIREFFPEFLRLFFADYARRFDLSAVEWLDKELFPDPSAGDKHLLDLVARLRATEPVVPGAADPTTWLALVHIEIESPDRTTLLKPRLPGYYLHLRERYGLPVLPVVLYLKVGLDGVGTDVVVERFWEFKALTFRYLYVGLPGLDAEPYLRGDNWLGVALSALMRMPRERVVELGAEALLRISGAPVTEEQRFLLGECVEAYLPIDEAESERFRGIIEANATGRVQPVNKTSFDRGMEQGRQEGRQEGQALALRAAVLELLEAKFGPPPADLTERVDATNDPAALRRWLLAAGQVDSLGTFRERVSGCPPRLPVAGGPRLLPCCQRRWCSCSSAPTSARGIAR